MEIMEEDSCDEENPFFSIFQKHVILRKLETFLEWEDLAKLRQICTLLNQIILLDTKFVSKTKLVLQKSVLEDPCLKAFSFNPKLIEIYPFRIGSSWDDPRILDATSLVGELLENCDCLRLWNRATKTFGFLRGFIITPDCTAALTNRETATLPPRYYAPAIPRLLPHMGNVKELEFFETAELFFSQVTEKEAHYLSALKSLNLQNSQQELYVPRIFLGLKGLQVFRFSSPYNHCLPTAQFIHRSRLAKIVANNADTLTALSEPDVWYFSPGSNQSCDHSLRVCPKLASLCVHINDQPHGEAAIKFLSRNAAALTQLYLRFDTPEALKPLVKCNRNLRELHLTCGLLQQSNPALVQQSLSYVRTTSVQNLVLDSISASRGLDEDLQDVAGINRVNVDMMSILPPYLTKLKIYGPFLDPSRYFQFFDASKLGNIPHVTNLLLSQLEGVTNEFVREIFNRLLYLRCVTICHLKQLTDAAFLPAETIDGTTNCHKQQAPPLANLKDLKKLTIFDTSVTCKTLRRGIQSNNLRKLTLWSNSFILLRNEEDFFTLLQHNPALEYLTCDTTPVDLNSIKNRFPNLKSVEYN